ncbi:MAG: hypothetical protein IJV12_06730, partial [Acidaminococcaceae bacterium]|nr:hypothetical protein [Acidaminococcaceae bacterium]
QDCLRAQPEFRSHRHLNPWNSKREQFLKLCPQRDFEALAERYEGGISLASSDVQILVYACTFSCGFT